MQQVVYRSEGRVPSRMRFRPPYRFTAEIQQQRRTVAELFERFPQRGGPPRSYKQAALADRLGSPPDIRSDRREPEAHGFEIDYSVAFVRGRHGERLMRGVHIG